MTKMTEVEKATLALNIGKTAKLLDDGYSFTEIAVKLGKPESTIRKWVSMITESRETSK